MSIIEQLSDKTGGKDRSNRSNAAIACLVAGAVVGLMIGYSKKWNMIYSAAGGAMIGGVAGVIFTPSSSK